MATTIYLAQPLTPNTNIIVRDPTTTTGTTTPSIAWQVGHNAPALVPRVVQLDGNAAAPIFRQGTPHAGWLVRETLNTPPPKRTVQLDNIVGPIFRPGTPHGGWLTGGAAAPWARAQQAARLDTTSAPIFVPAPAIPQTGWLARDTAPPPPRRRMPAFDTTSIGLVPPAIPTAPSPGWMNADAPPLPPVTIRRTGVTTWSVVFPIMAAPPMGWMVQSDMALRHAVAMPLDGDAVGIGQFLRMYVDPLHMVQYPEPTRAVQYPRGT